MLKLPWWFIAWFRLKLADGAALVNRAIASRRRTPGVAPATQLISSKARRRQGLGGGRQQFLG